MSARRPARSIASRVTFALVSVSTVLLATAGVIARESYRSEQLRKLQERAEIFADQLALGLSSPLWNFDRPTLYRIIDGALRHNGVSALAVTLADDGSTLYARTHYRDWTDVHTPAPPDSFYLERPIVFDSQHIGTVKMWGTRRFVLADVRNRTLLLAFGIIGFDLALILVLYASLRRIVLQPLARVERYAQAVSSNRSGERPSQTPGPLRGELASLQESLVRMIDRLREMNLTLVESQREAYGQLRAWHRRLELSKDEERRLLSRELHDELGQTLTALKLRLKMLSQQGDPAVVAARVQDALALVDGLIDRVRKIAVDLRPPLLDELGLESALRAFLDSRAQLGGTQWSFDAQGLSSLRLAPEVEIACFRIVQEAVTNVLRHARARNGRVRVTHAQDQLSIAVLDDGCGFSQEQALARAKAGHLGLVGMRERAHALGGELVASSPPASGEPSGTLIAVRLPAPPYAAAQLARAN